jgi:glycosyltransferase involved in cell wall biosynthesis
MLVRPTPRLGATPPGIPTYPRTNMHPPSSAIDSNERLTLGSVVMLNAAFDDYQAGLANAVDEFTSLNVTLVVPTPKQPRFKRLLSSSIDIETFDDHRVRDPRGIKTAIEIARILSRVEPDVVHHQVGGEMWLGLAAAQWGRSRPLVSTIHEVRSSWRHEDYWWTGALRWLALRSGRHFILLSHHTAELLAQKGIARDALSVVGHGEIASLYRRGPSPGGPRGQTALFFGRVRPYKGLDLLLEAAGRVVLDCPDFRLTIAGECPEPGDYFPDGVPPWIDLRARAIDDHEIQPLFDASRVVVLPYRQSSQSGVPPLGLGFGVPVIASAIGGLSEGLRDGENALIVDPEDIDSLEAALRRLMVDDEEAAHLRKGASGPLQPDWADVARAHAEIYRSALTS